MKVFSYVVSLLCLYLMVQAWSFLWVIHLLLPMSIVVAALSIVLMLLVTAEDRKKARSDRIFEEMSDRFESEQEQK